MALGNPYLPVTVVNYNLTPPSDAGGTAEENRVKWDKHKTKLGDPLKTAVDATQTAITAALDQRIGNAVITKTTNYTVTLADRGKIISVTTDLDVTITLPSSVTAKVGFEIIISNDGAGITTVDGNAAETINGSLTVLVVAGATLVLVNDGTNWLSLNRESTASTGDLKPTFKTIADAGWVILDDGTIGNAASGASTRANADTEALFTLLWDNILDTWAPVSTGRGASAAADFAANKTITLPLVLGRALGTAGTGATLTARALGENLGAETHQLTTAELPSHAHTTQRDSVASGAATNRFRSGAVTNSGTVSTSSVGSNTAHNNVQPTLFVNWMIKL